MSINTISLEAKKAILRAILIHIESMVFADFDDTVARIATRHGVSPDYVKKIFENIPSPSELLLHHRLTAAYRLLNDPRSKLTIAAIAFDVGFSDLSYFNRKFRAIYGATPSTVRRSATTRSVKRPRRQDSRYMWSRRATRRALGAPQKAETGIA